MPTPTTPVLATFTTAENPLVTGFSCPWFFGDGNLQSSGGVATDTGVTYSEAYYDLATYGPDCEAYVTISSYSAVVGHGFLLGVRQIDPDLTTMDGYYLFQNGSTAVAISDTQIRRVDNLAETVLGATFSMTLAAGDSVMLQAQGDRLSAWSNNSGTWTEITFRTDGTYAAAGAFGLGLRLDGTTLDNFGGGTLIAPETPRLVLKKTWLPS